MSNSERVQILMAGAIELPPEQRGAYLDAACRGDQALRADVESLLLSHDEAGRFMDKPTMDDIHSTDADSSATISHEGKMIGRYKLLQPIGEGGFGVVYMAEQREPVKRRVALKIIKLGMDTRQVIARFEAERQALAMMDHPNIAKVLDAGSTDTGRPYFVMEYIKGVPIIEYCDTDKLDMRARLALFMSVCHAIQHAHQKGIIHRDIKPSNVLVTMHDGVPVPKVIDFGIAKATSAELTTRTLFTEHRQMIGTPAYMSPEQAEMSGLDIDTRSDIYSLGVLLYELLTGTTPFASKSLLEAGFAEMMRIIREVEPHKPSMRLSSLGATGTRTAEQRHAGDVKKLGLLLKGDLDWIVMKCLEKDRTRRYETANGLADDIRRHLSDEPVTAGAPGAGYRLRKFARRNRAQVIAASVVAAALVLGVMGTSGGMVWAVREKNHAEAERAKATVAAESEAKQRVAAEAATTDATRQRDEANRQTAIAEAVARFQTDMLATADPNNLLGDKVTVVQAMEAATKALDKGSLKDQPLVEAQVHNTIGMTLVGLARYTDAEPNLRKSLALRRAALPAGHPDIAKSLDGLATLLKAQNKLSEAEPLFREALAIDRAASPAGHPDIAWGLNNLALLLMDQHKLTEAEPLLRDALNIFRASRPAGHSDIANALNNLGALLLMQRKFQGAEPLFRESLVIDRATRPAGHPHIAVCLDNLSKSLSAQRKFAEAEPLMREALEIRRAALPAGHPDIAKGLCNLASLLEAENKRAEAEPLAREAVEILRTALPAGHPELASSLTDLASLLQARNQLAEAEPLFREALRIERANLPGGDPRLAVDVSLLALNLQAQNKLDEAEPLFREVLQITRGSLPAGHPDIAKSLNNLGSLLQARGNLDEAEPLIREALEIDRTAFPADHPFIARDLNFLGVLLMEQQKTAESEAALREALKIDRAAYPPGDREIGACLNNLGTLCWREGKLDQSIPMFEELLKLAKAAFGPEHPDTIRIAADLGVMYKDSGRVAEAIPLLEEAYLASKHEPSVAGIGSPLLDAYVMAADPSKPQTINRVMKLVHEMLTDARASLPKDSAELSGQLAVFGLTLLELKAWDEAEPLISESLKIRQEQQPDAWQTSNTKSMLGGALLGQGKFADAEPLLLEGYSGMKQREATIPPQAAIRISQAIERLVQLYELKNNAPEAAAWRAKLEAARAQQAQPKPAGGTK